ncbi:probable cytochrome P450 9f2 [Armigeres subalbatus]|uniref:probable cytochrome P450 9f2 n=1 Tax=Armigeres subalbatus TaxID=124917 RepID=UPI002ED4C3A2
MCAACIEPSSSSTDNVSVLSSSVKRGAQRSVIVRHEKKTQPNKKQTSSEGETGANIATMDFTVLGTITAVVIVLGLIYRYMTRNDFYFADKPMPFLKPVFGVGNLGPLLRKKRDILEHFAWLYNRFPNDKVYGMFNMLNPVFVIRDPEMLKRIAVKDFDHFVDHSSFGGDQELDSSHMLVLNSLVALRGNKWRDMRATLSPAFTGSKMRQMFGLIGECGQRMVEFYKGQCQDGATEKVIVEMKELFSRFANDVIATTAFGIEVDSFRQPENEIFLLGKAVMQPNGFWNTLKGIGYILLPKLMVKMNVDFLSKEHDQFFRRTIHETIKNRQEHNIYRPDMIELLMQAKKGNLKHSVEKQSKEEAFSVVKESQVGKRNHDRVWTDSELLAQALIFFTAGFETVSVTLSFMAYELTRNKDVQNRLYEEILETERSLEGKPLSYEVLQAMVYMDMVVSEVMRVWPIGTIVDRLCVKDYVYDDGQGCRFTIEKGRTVMASVIGFHRDPKYYLQPERFDPERFSAENRRNINPDTYLPFGIGPRNCIGSRFALMEMKAVVYYLLLNFSFEVTEKTQIPLKLEKSPTKIASENGIWLELKPRVSKL